jgi:hypothetical protein
MIEDQEKSAHIDSEIDRRLTRKEKKALRVRRRIEARQAKLPIPRLTDDELRQRLTLSFDGLVEEIHNTALRQNQVEDQRESRLDAKAQGLMGTASLSLTVAFTFGGILLQYPDYLAPLGRWPSRAIFALYALSLFCGLFACILAVRALYITDGYRCLSERAVFHDEQLKSIEALTIDDVKAKSVYRRFLTIQLWTNWQQAFAVHERKATSIKRGQQLFLCFLSALMLIGGALTYAAYTRHETSPPIGLKTTP